jgi:hypothetical protein
MTSMKSVQVESGKRDGTETRHTGGLKEGPECVYRVDFRRCAQYFFMRSETVRRSSADMSLRPLRPGIGTPARIELPSSSSREEIIVSSLLFSSSRAWITLCRSIGLDGGTVVLPLIRA